MPRLAIRSIPSLESVNFIPAPIGNMKESLLEIQLNIYMEIFLRKIGNMKESWLKIQLKMKFCD